MDEMKKIPEVENNEEVIEQANPAPESESVVKSPTPKAPVPKLPLIIGGAIAGVVAIAVTVALILGDGNGNQGGENPPEDNGHEHSYGEWTLVDEPTCTVAGVEERACECGNKETRPVAAIGHTYDNSNDADCNVCGATRVVDCTHTETEVILGKAATCTETGLTDGTKCKKCGTTLDAQHTIPMVAHAYDNKYDEDCNVCGHKRDAECAHAETTVIPGKPATCTATGITDGSKCMKCGEILTEQTIISIKPHTEVTDAAVAATCTSTGLTEGKHCSECSKVLVAQTTVAMKPHTEVTDAAVAATCTATGLTEGKHCSVCSKVIVAQNVIPASHKYSDNFTYDADYHWKKCDVCSNQKNKSTHVMNDEGTMCLVCNPNAQPTEGVIYDVSVDGTYAEVIGYDGNAHNVKIAEEYNGLPVKAIFNAAFRNNKNLTTVIIPDSVTDIGQEAFYRCDSLTSVVIPDSVINVDFRAFAECDALTSVVIGEGVTRIGRFAFSYCYSLTSINIPDSVTSIGWGAFEHCHSSLYTEYEFGKYLRSDNNPYAVFIEPTNKNMSSYTIHKDTKHIGGKAFSNCSRLTSIIIPDRVTSIGESAFSYCGSLTSVVIGKSVASIDKFTFIRCSSLTSIVISNSVTNIGEGAFDECHALTDVYYTGSAEEWEKISIVRVPLTKLDYVTKHFNYVSEV